MTKKVRITVRADNTAESPGLLAEYGLSFWIETGSQCILIDTGQGNVFLHNAYRLGIPCHVGTQIEFDPSTPSPFLTGVQS